VVVVVMVVVLVVVRMPAVVLHGLRGGGGGRAQRGDQRHGESRRDHALEEGAPGVIGRRLADRLVVHGFLLSAVRLTAGSARIPA
jgi:hypothetical protein